MTLKSDVFEYLRENLRVEKGRLYLPNWNKIKRSVGGEKRYLEKLLLEFRKDYSLPHTTSRGPYASKQ